jgi:hypothetical protein
MPPPLTETERESLRGSLITLRIVVFALAMGVTSFAVISIFQKLSAPPNVPPAAQLAGLPGGMEMLHLVAIACGAGAAVIAFLVPPFLRLPPQAAQTPNERSGAIQAAAQMVQTRTIIACSLLEGAAFFNLVWYFTDGSVYNLAMGGVLLVLILMHLPLSGSYYDKIERLLGVDPFAVKWQEP